MTIGPWKAANCLPGADDLSESSPADLDLGMAVVVVNFGAHSLIRANLASLSPQVPVFVVDNFHSDAERIATTALCTERSWEFIPRPNRGYGAGCNAGIRRAIEAGCRAVLVLNPDAAVTNEVVRELHAHVAREPLSLVSPLIEDTSGRRVFQGVELMLDDGTMRRAGSSSSGMQRPARLWLTGACIALHADAFARIGGFDERYFLYWEDVDLSLRASRAGCALVIRHDLVAVHDEGGTQEKGAGQRAKSETYYYYNCRNRLLFAAEYLSRRQILHWLLNTPRASWEILMRGGKRQLMYSRGPLRATVRGTAAGAVAAFRALVEPSTRSDLQ